MRSFIDMRQLTSTGIRILRSSLVVTLTAAFLVGACGGDGESQVNGSNGEAEAPAKLTEGSSVAPAPSDAKRVVPESRSDVQLSFAPVAKQVAPAVVNIYTRRVVQQ